MSPIRFRLEFPRRSEGDGFRLLAVVGTAFLVVVGVLGVVLTPVPFVTLFFSRDECVLELQWSVAFLPVSPGVYIGVGTGDETRF